MKHTRALAVFAGLLLVFALLIAGNTFSTLRSSLTDRLYGGKPTLSNIVIIKIDDASINAFGRWPWNRAIFSQLLDKVKDARAIGVDVSFFEPSVSDASLNATLQNMHQVVLSAELQDGVLETPIFAAKYGYANMLTDADGVARRVSADLAPGTLPFAYALYQLGWKSNLSLSGVQRVNFAGRPNSFTSYSLKDIIASNVSFADTFVLIGATAPDLHDEYFVPTSEGAAMSGVEIHANILQNLILNNFVQKQGTWSLLAVILLTGALGMFVLSRLKIFYAIPAVIGLMIGYGLIAVLVYRNFNIIIDLFFPPIALFVFTAGGVGIHYMEEQRHSAYLRDAFSKYVSKELLTQLLEKRQELTLGGGKRTLTVFFSDIRGFTGISEKLTPEQLTHLLNEYLTAMTRIILKHQGTVDKFIGDAVMAFWNAPVDQPKHAAWACAAAVEQVQALATLRDAWKAQGLPEITIGCGIHSGPAVVGNMGSEERFDYTAIGDTVNLASRLEGLTKEYGVEIIASEETAKDAKDFTFRKLDAVKVKGKEIPVVIHELVPRPNVKFIHAFEQALARYLKSDFSVALKGFQHALTLDKDDKPCALFIERCELYLKHPPPKDWDGAFEMKTK